MATAAAWINEMWASILTWDWVLGIGRGLEVLWPSFFTTFILVSAPYFFSLVPNAIVAHSNYLLSGDGIAMRILTVMSRSCFNLIEAGLNLIKRITGWLLNLVTGINKAEGFLDSIYKVGEFGIRWYVFYLAAATTYFYIETFTPDAFSHYQAIISGEEGLASIPNMLLGLLNPNSWFGWVVLVIYVVFLSPFAFGTLTYFTWRSEDPGKFIILQTRMWSRKILTTFTVIGILSGFSAALSVNSAGLISDLSVLSGHVFLISMIMGMCFLILSLIIWISTAIQKLFFK